MSHENDVAAAAKDVVDTSHLRALAANKGTEYQLDTPDPQLLEAFENPFFRIRPSRRGTAFGTVNIVAPEFTSLCPLTGQPDFATIVINYHPDQLCVESKSFKLYLMGFRNHGEFHEACIARIGSDLVNLLDPFELEVEGQFTPRGGIPFWPKFTFKRSTTSNG